MDEWNQTDSRWQDVDTATVVSIGSSCVILISGCIAVVCLILYMKKSEQQMQRFRTLSVCAKCGATVVDKRSVGVVTDVPDIPIRRQSAPPDRQPPLVTTESALYAISGADFEAKVGEEALLGVICGHVSDTQTTTYSTNPNDQNVVPIRRLRSCSHSQCSHDSELIYELSRDRRKLSFESFEVYESIGSERETPTDPGIRQFTESPPKPNERRQGVVQHVTNDATTPTNEHFGAIPRYRSRQPMWKLSNESQTIKCLSALTSHEVNGLSSDSDDDLTPPHKSIDC